MSETGRRATVHDMDIFRRRRTTDATAVANRANELSIRVETRLAVTIEAVDGSPEPERAITYRAKA